MSEALGRPVYVGGMQLRLLPMPGIVMSDFTVDEDPAFGYEPALHASSVVAALRLSSLWRGAAGGGKPNQPRRGEFESGEEQRGRVESWLGAAAGVADSECANGGAACE